MMGGVIEETESESEGVWNGIVIAAELLLKPKQCLLLISIKYCFRLTVREGCVDILFYLKILSVLDKSDAYRQHTK